jgi:hypothetical protein
LVSQVEELTAEKDRLDRENRFLSRDIKERDEHQRTVDHELSALKTEFVQGPSSLD